MPQAHPSLMQLSWWQNLHYAMAGLCLQGGQLRYRSAWMRVGAADARGHAEFGNHRARAWA